MKYQIVLFKRIEIHDNQSRPIIIGSFSNKTKLWNYLEANDESINGRVLYLLGNSPSDISKGYTSSYTNITKFLEKGSTLSIRNEQNQILWTICSIPVNPE